MPAPSVDVYKRQRQSKSDPGRRQHVHLKSGMQAMAVRVIVGQNRHMGIPRVVQRLAKQRAVVGQTAVAHVFSHADGRLVLVILSAS